jgi:hydrogenase nickel incorporation protein HypB
MIRDAVEEFDLSHLDLLVVENVGNLVCPAEFNVGEDMKVMLASVTEGDDKPLKYPLMYQQSSALLINKIDLAPYVDCDADLIEKRAKALNESMAVFRTSCKTGAGIDAWCDWIIDRIAEKKKACG